VSPSVLARRRRSFAVIAAVSLAAVVAMLWPPNEAVPVKPPGGTGGGAYAAPPAYLAWAPGGFDDPGIRAAMEAVAAFDEVVVVAGDTLWLERTEDADGRVVDEPRAPYAFPIDAFAVAPNDYAPFVGASVRLQVTRALQSGKAVLGQHSARLRRLEPGGLLRFRNGSVRVGAVVPDEAVGWSEVMVNRQTARRLGIAHERYLLARSAGELNGKRIRRIVSPYIGGDPLRVDPPETTPYVRVASGVNPPILVKEAFGEFAAVQQADPAFLTIDPAWVDRNIVTTNVPILGTVTCHRRLIPMVREALREVIRAGLAPEIRVYSGCWVARTVARTSTAPPSTHAYGAAIDINAPYSPYGAPPNMNAEVVRIFEEWGFNWGGDFLIPDGHHFEFWDIPDQLRPAA
jgi:hypothetical protein